MKLDELKEETEKIIEEANTDIKDVNEDSSLNNFKNKFLGKKSSLSSFYLKMKEVLTEDKKDFGLILSNLKNKLTSLYEEKEKKLKEEKIQKKMLEDKVDITLPGRESLLGSKHPDQIIIDDIVSYLMSLGFSVEEGPEVDSDLNNFELVNIPFDHPSRDMQDSFSISHDTVLRSHTSCIQARVMAKMKGEYPVKIICPGKVYRRDNDATHSHEFFQCEGLVIGENVTMSHLLENLKLLLKHIFGEKREVRFRPSYFPFTEPSIEVDISCAECSGKGCHLCKNTGFIEVLGAGMVHPNVLRLNGYDDKKVSGYAFGIGIDRIAMLKYKIEDIKNFYVDDVNFLKQFSKE